MHRSGAGEARGGPQLRSAGCQRRGGTAAAPRSPSLPTRLTYPGLPFQLGVQTGALEFLDYLSNNERQIRLLLQHFPCPSPPSGGDRPPARRQRAVGSHLRLVTLVPDLISLGLLQRALPGNWRAVCPFLSSAPRARPSQHLRSEGGKTI